MTSFNNYDFFDFASSPLSPAVSVSPRVVQLEVARLVPSKVTSPQAPLRPASVSWEARDYWLSSLGSSARDLVGVPQLTSPPGAFDSGSRGTDDAMDDFFGGFLLDNGDRTGSGRARSPMHRTSAWTDTESPTAAPWQAATNGNEDPTNVSIRAPWEADMAFGPTPPAAPSAARTRHTTASRASSGMDDDAYEALEQAYFADIMPLLVECGEAMQRQRSAESLRLGGAATDSGDDAKHAAGYFALPDLSWSEGGTPLQTSTTHVRVHDPTPMPPYHVLSLSPSSSRRSSDEDDDPNAAGRWLGGGYEGIFYLSPEPAEAWSHVPAPPPPLTLMQQDTAVGRPTETCPAKTDTQSLPAWAVPEAEQPTPAPQPAPVKRTARRHSRHGGKPVVPTTRRALDVAAVEDLSGTELGDADASMLWAPPADDEGTTELTGPSVTAPGRPRTTRPAGAAAGTSSAPRLQTVLVLPNNAAPSTAVSGGGGAFHAFAYLSVRGLLQSEALSHTAARVVAGECGASIIMHRAVGSEGAGTAAAWSPLNADKGREPTQLAELSSFFSVFFQDLARRTAQAPASTLCAHASVVLLRQDMYRDLLQPAAPNNYHPLLLSGTPLLGPRLGGATLQILTSCAGTMDLLKSALDRLTADDLAVGVLLVSVYVKQTASGASTGSRTRRQPTDKDVLLSSYSALCACPQALHDAALSHLYPLTSGLIQRCFRGAVFPTLFASLYEMTPSEQQLATQLTTHFYEQFCPSAAHPGSVTQLLGSIHRQAKVFHGMLSTARAESDATRQTWQHTCSTTRAAQEKRKQARPRSRSATAPTRAEAKKLTQLHTAYQRHHRRWLRLDFLLRSLAGIAADCEATLQAPVSVLPPVYLITSHYLRQPDAARRGGPPGATSGAWMFVSAASPDAVQNVRFASHQPLYASDSEDDDEYVPANTPFGEQKLAYPFPFRQRRSGQPGGLGEADIPRPLDSAALNLFSGGYTSAMSGIRPLLDPADSHLRRLFGLPLRVPSSRTSVALPCALIEAPENPLVRSVVWLTHGAAASPDTLVVEETCVQRVDDRTVQSGSPDAPRVFHVDEVCVHTDTHDKGADSRGRRTTTTTTAATPTSSALLTQALSEFTKGFNTHVYYAVVVDPCAADRQERLRRVPLWSMLTDMAATALHSPGAPKAAPPRRGTATKTGGAPSLFLSACHISSSTDFVRDHLSATAPPSTPAGTDFAPTTATTTGSAPPLNLRPFRAAWTAAGPIVEGCRYNQIHTAAALEAQLETVMANMETAGRRNTDVHVRLSFLLHQPGQDGDALLSSLTVWLTTNSLLFASLGVQTSVPLSHKLNLLRPHYCQSVVYVTDVRARGTAPEACAAALWRQTELSRTMPVPLFPCAWSLRTYLQYLSDRQAAFREAAAALERAEAAASGKEAKPAAFAITMPPLNGAVPVCVGTAVRARDVLDACGMLERMRGVVMRALTPEAGFCAHLNATAATAAPTSTTSATVRRTSKNSRRDTQPTHGADPAAACTGCRVLALSSTGSGLYDITAVSCAAPAPAPLPAPEPSAASPSPTPDPGPRTDRTSDGRPDDSRSRPLSDRGGEDSATPPPGDATVQTLCTPSIGASEATSRDDPAHVSDTAQPGRPPSLSKGTPPPSSPVPRPLFSRASPPPLARLPGAEPTKAPPPLPDISDALLRSQTGRAAQQHRLSLSLSPPPLVSLGTMTPPPAPPTNGARASAAPAQRRLSHDHVRLRPRPAALTALSPSSPFGPHHHSSSTPSESSSSGGAAPSTSSIVWKSTTAPHLPSAPSSTKASRPHPKRASTQSGEQLMTCSVPVLPSTPPCTSARVIGRSSSAML